MNIKKYISKFTEAIQKFNNMYRMPFNDKPTIISAKRLQDFLVIIRKEVDEGDEILDRLVYFEKYKETMPALEREETQVSILTDLADWFGDLQVYEASEMVKWGLPQDQVLEIIMDSNFSKMGADGLPIYDSNDKLQKGPNYWKPEGKIALLIESLR